MTFTEKSENAQWNEAQIAPLCVAASHEAILQEGSRAARILEKSKSLLLNTLRVTRLLAIFCERKCMVTEAKHPFFNNLRA